LKPDTPPVSDKHVAPSQHTQQAFNAQHAIGAAGSKMGLEPVRSARWVLRIGFLGLLALIAWASLSEIEQITRAPGQVIAIARTQTVQAPDGGVVLKILVKEGQTVVKGQVLAKLEQSRAQAAVNDSQAKVAALKITLIRLQTEVLGRKLVFPPALQGYTEYIQNQTDLYKQRQQAINEEIQALQDSLRLAKEELAMNKPLLETGDVARADIIKLERQVTEVQSQITNRKNKYIRAHRAKCPHQWHC
jgi:membrane fusion protein, adhesin transport system